MGGEASAERAGGLLAGMRVRKKLIFLHTLFSLVLAGILAAALWPAINSVVEEAELHEARLAVRSARGLVARRAEGERDEAAIARVAGAMPQGVRLFGLTIDAAGRPWLSAGESAGKAADAGGVLAAYALNGESGAGRLTDGAVVAMWVDGASGKGLAAAVRLAEARGEVVRLYVFMTLALLGVYGLIALSLEVLVLPRHVYGPIRAILRADRAVEESRREAEIIPEGLVPADELGEIMRSRNRVVSALRMHEAELARALEQLAAVAGDLKRKNHLLEAAQRNLADADRLASLGMMSAGLAHELNTPLAVIKGLVEQLEARADRSLGAEESRLLLRVVGRLERLSDGLLDFARARPMRMREVALAPLVDEAWTLVSLDREAGKIELVNAVPGSGSLFAAGEGAAGELMVRCDHDRMLQVLVNLLRNAVDALTPAGRVAGRIEVGAAATEREGRAWVTISIADNGPGIDPEVLGRLFEPFVSTRLDSRGTGLGLAVSEGIVREHGGVLVARNRGAAEGGGSVFEITLPVVRAG